MALRKPFDTKAGVIVDYWRIAALVLKPGESLGMEIHGYLSQEMRDAGKAGLISKQYAAPAPENYEANLMAEAYDFLKKHPDYLGAEDV